MSYNPLGEFNDEEILAETRRRGIDSQSAIRAYVVAAATLIIDNSEHMYTEVTEAALSAVQNDMGSGWDREAFVEMLAGRGQTDRSEVADVVGIAVCATIREWLDPSDPLHAMLADLLDLGDREQGALFGEHFMPEEGDWDE